MKPFVNIAILVLAMYAHGASADPAGFLVLSQQQQFGSTEVQSIKPAWSLVKTEAGGHLVGFANFSRIQNLSSEDSSEQQGFGVGFYQQHTPWFHSQLLVQQHPLVPNQVQSLMEWIVGF